MKKILSFAVLAAILAACSSGPQYVINGKIEGADSVMFLLQKREAGSMVTLDSAMAYKGSFKIKGGPVKNPEMVMLTVRDSRMRTQFFLENAEITITGKLDSLYGASITGSKTQDEYSGLVKSMNDLGDKNTEIYNQYQVAAQEGDTARVADLEKQVETIQEEMLKVQADFVRNNPASFAAPQVLAGLAYEITGTEIETLIGVMDTAVANTALVKELKERALKMKAVEPGQKAPDFTLNDPEGNPVSLYSKVGIKASASLISGLHGADPAAGKPECVKAYKEFNKKGFDVFGVSLDRTKDDWVKAIADDQLTWTHVSDLQYWNNEAARMYSVNSIPANFLLDENGIIIGRNLRGQGLYNKIKEVLGN